MLNSLRPASASTDHLFVGTDRQLYFTLAWDAAAKQLRTATAFVDQADTTARDSQSYDRCAFDPARRFLTLELFEGILTVIPVGHEGGGKGKQRGGGAAGGEVGALAEPIPVRVPELFIRSWTYLHPRGPTDGPRAKKPRLALLFDDSRGRVRLHVKELDYAPGYSGEPGQAEFEDLEPVQKPVDPSASHVVPVAAPVYGLLVLAETAVTYVDEESTLSIRDPLPDATIFATWAVVDDTRWLLADDYGRLYFLMLLLSDDYEVQGFKVDFLGRTSRASVITYLDSGYVFVGSHLGDSQVVKIGQGSIEVIQTISNISPVLDFTIMDMGNRTDESQVNEYSSGQARIVTGSGAFQDGSLRSVRSGVGIEELGSLGNMPGITELFSLKSVPDDERADTLIASFLEETRVFHFSAEGEVEEMQRFSGFTTSQSTVLAQNCPGGRALQCTSSGISLVDLESGMQTASWSPDTGAPIVAASANDSQVVLSVSGTELVSLDVTLDLRLIKRLKLETDRQISCIHLPSSTLDICVVGFWQEATVAILKSGSLEQVQSVVASEDSAVVPRSVLIAQVLAEHAPTLFVALSDGNVVTFELDQKSLSLTGRQSTILGTQQANLKALPRGDGLTNVFATCEHPSLIYGSEGRIVYSAVTVENASYVCPFDSEAYPGAIAIATNEDLKLALIDHERTTHVQKLAVGETVRRIAYSSRLKAFGMGTIRKELKGGAEIVKSHFKLADEVVFKELDTYDLKEDELVESVIRADVSDGLQGTAERFLVGTSYISEDEPESYKGRILILEVTEDRTLKLVSELNVRGACRALAVLDRKIVAALVKTVGFIPHHVKSECADMAGCRLQLRKRPARERRHLPHLDAADRHQRDWQPDRRGRRHEERVDRALPGRRRGPAPQTGGDGAPLPDRVEHGRRARHRRDLAARRRRGQPGGAAPQRRRRQRRRSPPPRDHQRVPARRARQPHPARPRAGVAVGRGAATGFYGDGTSPLRK